MSDHQLVKTPLVKKAKVKKTPFFTKDLVKCVVVLASIALVASLLLGVMNWLTYVDPDETIMKEVAGYFGTDLSAVSKDESMAGENVNACFVAKDGDTVLVAEGCTHHRQCGDIGTVKLPALLKKYTGKDIKIESASGVGFPDDLSKYALVMHCGGCMLNEREVINRADRAKEQGVPMTNYGTAIAYMNGILKRSLKPFPHLYDKIYKSGQMPTLS